MARKKEWPEFEIIGSMVSDRAIKAIASLLVDMAQGKALRNTGDQPQEPPSPESKNITRKIKSRSRSKR